MKVQENIPVANPYAQFVQYEAGIRSAINRVLENGQYILGCEVEAFEREFAEYIGIPFCVTLASGTDALALSMMACGVSQGDEVITVSNTAVATVAAIEQIGACPVFVDIDPETRCMNPEKITPLITEKTRAILPVHLYGYPAPLPEIREIAQKYNLVVIEDCAQAHGASIGHFKVGTLGDAAAFSFYPTKNLGALGDAGAVVTHRENVYQRLRQIRQYGWDDHRISHFRGVNSRMDELQAAVLRVKLADLDHEVRRRREIAEIYRSVVRNDSIVLPPKPNYGKEAVHLFVVESDHRDDFQAFFNNIGIETAIHYPVPIHQQPAYRDLVSSSAPLVQTEILSKRIVSLPMYPQLSNAQIDRICEALKRWRPY
jgi:dTDP-4-amino-4,6-dideoxygalactose transaminase